MKTFTSLILGLILTNFISQAQNVEIPDTAFLYALIAAGVDKNGDSLISNTEAEATHYINVYYKEIQDMKGLEAFVNLDSLDCSSNWGLKLLDVSNNTALKRLYCYTSGLSSLDLSKNVALELLSCSSNMIKSLDLSNNTALEIIVCNNNDLTSLDLSNNSALTYLDCRTNDLSNMNISNCPALAYLDCSDNNMASSGTNNNFTLDVTKNTNLEYLFCYNNQIPSLNISNNTALKSLHCGGNDLTSLDVSNNTALIDLDCDFNQLDSLDLSNNSNLLLLRCMNNQLTYLDVSYNNLLIELICEHNQLTSLDVSNCITLRKLLCSYNQLTSLDISNNNTLWDLWIGNMPSLFEVCVWTLPLPATLDVSTYNSPNAYFKDCRAPDIRILDTLPIGKPVRTISSENGMIYLVPKDTDNDLGNIRNVSIDSAITVAGQVVNFSTSSLDNGIYWLYARDGAGNISENEAFMIMGVGINQAIEKQIRIYPNPTKDLLTIETSLPGQHFIDITSLNGQLLYSDRMEGPTHQIDLSSFQKGLYFITIRSREFVRTEKIIKQ